jgi:two-component system chemotaxis response regulator CheB
MNSSKPIRVLVVDDSAFMRTALRRMLESDADIDVISTASDGTEAVEKIASLHPDVVTLDFEMPRMNGLEVLRRVMATTPLPIIMVSSITQEGAEATFDALEAGAFDYISKQLSYASLNIVNIREQLIEMVHEAAKMPRRAAPVPAQSPARYEVPSFANPRVITLGISTGGPKALQTMLPMLPADLAVPLVIVQHMPVGFTGPFAKRLDGLCRVRVSEAAPEETLEPGHVYIAPAGYQLTVATRGLSSIVSRLARTPSDTPHIPSVDVLMSSAAEVFRDRSMGVIMTGMGNDGERGMRAIFRAGGFTLGQDESTCIVYGMPRACAESGLLRRVSPLSNIANDIAIAASAQRACIPSAVATR